MSELVTGIRLSSGTTINIPIFPYNTERSIINRQGGIVRVDRYDRTAATPDWENIAGLSQADIEELVSLINGKICSGITHDTPNPPLVPVGTTDAYACSVIFYAEQGNGTFKLVTNLHSSTPVATNVYVPILATYGVDDPNDTSYETLHGAYNGINRRWGTYEAMCAAIATSSSWADYCYNLTNNSIDYDYIEQIRGIGSGTSYDVVDWDALLTRYTELVPNNSISLIETDPDNPYTYEASTFGGGDGRWGTFDPDSLDPAEIPALPTISAANAGFISIYNPTVNQLKALSAFLWSSAFDIDSFKKLFSDPMQCIIGLSVVPVRPPLSGAKNVMFGDIDTGVSMTAIASEYVEKDCGSVDLELLYGSFMDYSPYTKIQIYLPYIGFRDLSPDDIIGGSINVTYHINVLDGGCTAYISHSSRGVLYQHSGSCIANIPLSAINYSGALQNAISAVGSIATMGVGLATGAAPVTAMGAMGLATQAANTAVNSKPSVQRSGSVSGSSGLMGIQRPFVIIQRPNISVPALMNDFIGNTTNVTMRLADCEGFTMVDQIHLDNVLCTDEERNELLNLLKEGVIL